MQARCKLYPANKQGNTPLHLACFQNATQTIEVRVQTELSSNCYHIWVTGVSPCANEYCFLSSLYAASQQAQAWKAPSMSFTAAHTFCGGGGPSVSPVHTPPHVVQAMLLRGIKGNRINSNEQVSVWELRVRLSGT